jgi:hypothetical protein
VKSSGDSDAVERAKVGDRQSGQTYAQVDLFSPKTSFPEKKPRLKKNASGFRYQ